MIKGELLLRIYKKARQPVYKPTRTHYNYHLFG